MKPSAKTKPTQDPTIPNNIQLPNQSQSFPQPKKKTHARPSISSFTSLTNGTKKVKIEKPSNKPSKGNEEAKLSAQAYGIYQQQFNCVIEYNETEKREIASLTKMMTLFAALRISQRVGANIKTTYFRISENATSLLGTLADLIPQQWITIEDALYGLMLPSGNDAALVVAQNFGAILCKQKSKLTKLQTKNFDVSGDGQNLSRYIDEFVKYMNILAKQLKMDNTNFMNPHGLDCKQSYSTVKDVTILLNQLMLNNIALKIMGTRNYFARLKTTTTKQNNYHQTDWMNTNKLLWKRGFVAGKTGHTIKAGGCLATVYEHDEKQYYIVVLGCKGVEDRCRETEFLVNKYILKTG